MSLSLHFWQASKIYEATDSDEDRGWRRPVHTGAKYTNGSTLVSHRIGQCSAVINSSQSIYCRTIAEPCATTMYYHGQNMSLSSKICWFRVFCLQIWMYLLKSQENLLPIFAGFSGGFFPKALLLPTLDVARSHLPELNLGRDEGIKHGEILRNGKMRLKNSG